ncbi:hypothetical protein SAMN00017405_0028 [Desulfonispora thiosulfatigenes DSM 11270]|uniref:DUF116 domain-containing protein n=1 Tax=Desulfonispora thiosulfatigenes DSM 11270 TaxID=656914 RepID=A0A1W1VJ66_DESTI|nr:DUF116 domain-containing protein [Desulfonispora thiosulfatigenes]SMB93402.1 hypothetical protein SAMN00017405_0028 [Desulfonispora thiosulfatigenes DSM 11270]
MYETNKRLFIFLLLLSFSGLLISFYLAYLIATGLSPIFNRIFLVISFILVTFLFLFFGIGIALLIYSLWSSKPINSNKLIKKSILFLYPNALRIGKWFGLSSDKIKNSYIQVNNELVKLKKYKMLPEDILILAPHCLQNVKCPHKITIDVNNCKNCGLCKVGSLLMVSNKYNVDIVIATGGTFARKFVAEKRPKAIIAIACERDLTSGIQDVKDIPVLGVLNERPEGPCYNTQVSLGQVENAINFFLKGGHK